MKKTLKKSKFWGLRNRVNPNHGLALFGPDMDHPGLLIFENRRLAVDFYKEIITAELGQQDDWEIVQVRRIEPDMKYCLCYGDFDDNGNEGRSFAQSWGDDLRHLQGVLNNLRRSLAA